MLRILSPVLLLLVTLSVTAQPVVRRAAPRPKAVTLATSPATVPTSSFGGRPQIDVMIDGKGPFTFLVDTGASGTVITKQLFDELALPVVGEGRVGSPGGGPPMTTPITEIGVLSFGSIRIEGLPATVMDLSHLWKDGPRGILSPSALPDVLITLSLNPGTMAFERGALPEPDGRRVFEWAVQDRLPVVPVHIGDRTVMAHLDTGAPGGLKLPRPMATELGVSAPLRETGKAKLVDREVTMWAGDLPSAPTLAGIELPRTVIFQDGAGGPNLGVDILGRVRITLDVTNRRVRISPV